MSANTIQQDIPSNGWEIRPLGKIVRPTRPRVKPSERPHLPFIGMEHVEAHTMKLLGTIPATTMKSTAVHFQPGDVLYGRLRPYLNKVYRPDFEGLCSAEFIVFPKTEGIDSRYLQYFLNSSAFVSYASHLNTGDRPRVDFDQLAAYPFPVAPLDQQKRIVAEIEKQFSRLDEAVANLKRVKTNIKRYKAAVLKAAVEGRLVETEAERARREGRSYETGAQLLQRILEARRSRWTGKGKYKEPAAPDTANLPELPAGWVWATVDQLLISLRNGLSRKPEDSLPGIPILRISSVRPLELDAKDHRFYIPKLNERIDDYKLHAGDLLFVRYNGTKELVGACALVKMISDTLLYPDKLIRGRVVSKDLILPAYLAIAANTGASRRHIDDLIKTTAGQQGIAGGEIKIMPIPLPSHQEQQHIVAEVDRRLSLLRETEAQVEANLQRAVRLRQAILARAFSGGLTPAARAAAGAGASPGASVCGAARRVASPKSLPCLRTG